MNLDRILAASLCVVAVGCAQALPPQTDDEIRAELAKVPASNAGRWSSHFVLSDYSAAGLPQVAAESIRREIEGRGRLGQVSCVAPEAISMFQQNLTHKLGAGTCKVLAFRISGQAYEGEFRCKFPEGFEGRVGVSGQIGGDVQRDSVRTEASMASHPDFKMHYKLDIVSERTGECPATGIR